MIGTSNEPGGNDASRESALPPDSAPALPPCDLLPGDVLLYRPRSPNGIQRKISSATDSPYTHVAIYLGDDLVAESNFPHGVSKRTLASSIKNCRCVAVQRSQFCFNGDRPQKLRTFVDAVVARKRKYDIFSVLEFENNSTAYFDNHVDFIRQNYDKVKSCKEFSERSFFCSAFVVACYTVVGIIGDTAQAAYQPDNFSPGHLHQDPAFGWLLGFLVPEGGSVPEDDPVLKRATLWRDNLERRWW